MGETVLYTSRTVKCYLKTEKQIGRINKQKANDEGMISGVETLDHEWNGLCIVSGCKREIYSNERLAY